MKSHLAILEDCGTTQLIGCECSVCGHVTKLYVRTQNFEFWLNGLPIQDAFPVSSECDRELLTTGTCDKCQRNKK